MWNARLEEAQAGIKISGRDINNLRYAADTTLIAESEGELKNLLMKVKEESEKVGLKLNIQKTKIIASSPIEMKMKLKVSQLCLTLCNHMPGSSVHGILQAKILERIAMPCSRGSSQPKNWTCISYFPPGLAGGFCTTSATWEAHYFMANRWGNNGNSDTLYFLGLQNHYR